MDWPSFINGFVAGIGTNILLAIAITIIIVIIAVRGNKK